jgi:hypothetical protein
MDSLDKERWRRLRSRPLRWLAQTCPARLAMPRLPTKFWPPVHAIDVQAGGGETRESLSRAMCRRLTAGERLQKVSRTEADP